MNGERKKWTGRNNVMIKSTRIKDEAEEKNVTVFLKRTSKKSGNCSNSTVNKRMMAETVKIRFSKEERKLMKRKENLKERETLLSITQKLGRRKTFSPR